VPIDDRDWDPFFPTAGKKSGSSHLSPGRSFEVNGDLLTLRRVSRKVRPKQNKDSREDGLEEWGEGIRVKVRGD